GYLYQDSAKDFLILHSLDGYDEVSLTGPVKFFYNAGERVIEPKDLSMKTLTRADIRGGNTVEESAAIFMRVLEGKGTEQQNSAVIANAAMALFAADQNAGLKAAVDKAREALISGRALRHFKALLNN
ncbi:MAG TPA: anthranilate phosphoribosyltransferase, partial [Chryseosolibacter sp.]